MKKRHTLEKEEINKRNIILFKKKKIEYSGGIVKFDDLNEKDVIKLIEMGLIDPNGRQNESYTAAEIISLWIDIPEKS